MPGFLASTLIAFVGVVALIAAVALTLIGSLVLVIARKGDRPFQLSPRGLACCAISLGVLMWAKALDVVASVSL